MSKFGNSIRHGLLMERILGKLRRIGVDIKLNYLIREGDSVSDMSWPDLSEKYTSSLVTEADMSSMATFTTWLTEERIRKRLEKGDIGIVLKDGDGIAAYTWADLDEVNDVNCDHALQPGEAYLYNAFTAPNYRGQGLASFMRFECYKQLRLSKIHTFYSLSGFFNSPSIRFKQKLQAEIVRLYLKIRIGRFVLCDRVIKNYGRMDLQPG